MNDPWSWYFADSQIRFWMQLLKIAVQDKCYESFWKLLKISYRWVAFLNTFEVSDSVYLGKVYTFSKYLLVIILFIFPESN